MVAFSTEQPDLLELRAFLAQNTHVGKPIAGQDSSFLFRLRENGQLLWKQAGCDFIEVIEMQMRHNNGINLKKIFNRTRKIAIRIAAARVSSFRH